MKEKINALNMLRSYCENEDFQGWDPYDGLNSKIFQALPFLKKSALARLIWIQFFKRCPVNFRSIMQIPKGYNPKGVALFLQGYCNLYKIYQDSINEQRIVLDKIDYLANMLLSLKTEGYSGACWGYNFDWQARRLFFFPKGTPTVVVTSFCGASLLAAYEVTGNVNYLKTALSSADFILNDLHRTALGSGFLFSYSPLPGNDTVFNASLLGSKLLGLVYRYTGNKEYMAIAKKSIMACCEMQGDDGSWVYGMLPVQNWIDSFHTGYNLESLMAYKTTTGDNSFDENITRGTKYYLNNFFEKDGTPQYYNNKIYPIDIHCPAQFIITLCKLNKLEENKELADNVLNWMIGNMQDSKGYFYYQIRKHISSKIPYMRWNNAFAFYAMTCYLLHFSQ
jgi:rhamnogalacturonyl hydrolase YesR